MTSFDGNSGIRERLALLAHIGPALDPHVWGYNPSRDRWYYCGPPAEVKGAGIEVRHEGVRSLELIEKDWGMDRVAAMAFIGYPEVVR